MTKKNIYNDYVVSGILVNNQFEIVQVKELQSLKTIILDRNKYQEIEQLIINHDWGSIANLDSPDATGFREYLDVVKFRDQNDRTFVATIYDSDELFQDPQVINIFLVEDEII
jgi:hypothetical protein